MPRRMVAARQAARQPISAPGPAGTNGSCGAVRCASVQCASLESWSAGGDPRSASDARSTDQRDPCQRARAGGRLRQLDGDHDRLARAPAPGSPDSSGWSSSGGRARYGMVRCLPAGHEARARPATPRSRCWSGAARSGPSGATGGQNGGPSPGNRLGGTGPPGASASSMRPASSRAAEVVGQAVEQPGGDRRPGPAAEASRSCSARSVIEPTSASAAGMSSPRCGLHYVSPGRLARVARPAQARLMRSRRPHRCRGPRGRRSPAARGRPRRRAWMRVGQARRWLGAPRRLVVVEGLG